MYHVFQHHVRVEEHETTVYTVMGDNHVLRWYALIAAYGVLIPLHGPAQHGRLARHGDDAVRCVRGGLVPGCRRCAI